MNKIFNINVVHTLKSFLLFFVFHAALNVSVWNATFKENIKIMMSKIFKKIINNLRST